MGCSPDSGTSLNELPQLAAHNEVTVSGLSSGAYMATQYHVAFAGDVTGAALIAGGPWACAEGNLGTALGPCISGDGIDVPRLVTRARQLAAEGAIDSPAALSGDRVFLFHGAADESVSRAVVAAADRWYVASANGIEIEFIDTVAAAHGWPTVDYGAACAEFAPPYVNACDYDLAGELLQYLYRDLQAPATAPAGELLMFRQPEAVGLAESGYVYLPRQCTEGDRCAVHLFFHGCGQAEQQVGDALVRHAGFNRWADSNDLIVLYPQVAPSNAAPQNPFGCWDWWGYSGDDYLDRTGEQLAAVHSMVQRLTSRN